MLPLCCDVNAVVPPLLLSPPAQTAVTTAGLTLHGQVTQGMGRAIMGTGEASGEGRAEAAADAAIRNPLLGDVDLRHSKGHSHPTHTALSLRPSLTAGRR